MDTIKKYLLPTNKQLGMRIRYLRKQKKWSIEFLALEAGIHPNYLGDLERGQRNPTLDVLAKISVALNIRLEEMFKGIEVYY